MNDMRIDEMENDLTGLKFYIVDKGIDESHIVFTEQEMNEIVDYMKYIDLKRFVKESLPDVGYSRHSTPDKVISNIAKIMFRKGFETTQDIDYILEEMPAREVLDIL